MKKTIFIYLLLTSLFISCKTTYPPSLQLQKKSSVTPYYKMFGLKDTNAIIVSIGISGYWVGAYEKKFVCFLKNNKVKVFKTIHPFGTNTKKTIKEYKLSNKESRNLYEKLIFQVQDSNFSFSQKELNITEKESGNGMIESMQISDGARYGIMIFQAGKYSAFSTSNPWEYIGNNYPGKEERIRFMKLYKEFETKLKVFK